MVLVASSGCSFHSCVVQPRRTEGGPAWLSVPACVQAGELAGVGASQLAAARGQALALAPEAKRKGLKEVFLSTWFGALAVCWRQAGRHCAFRPDFGGPRSCNNAGGEPVNTHNELALALPPVSAAACIRRHSSPWMEPRSSGLLRQCYE